MSVSKPVASPSASQPSVSSSSDDDDKPIGLRNPKPADPKSKPNPSVKKNKPVANTKKAKEEADDSNEDELIVKKRRSSVETSSSAKVVKKQEEVKIKLKKEKKVYDLPGQKRDPPEERDPLRIFYETLYQQVSTSEMAQIWMMESGLLPESVAKQVFEKKQKKVQTLRSPAKAPSSQAKNTTKSVTVKKDLSSATKTTKSVTVKEQPSSADAMKKKKTPDSKISSKPSNKRKTADGSDDGESDDDFEVISQPKKRKLAG